MEELENQVRTISEKVSKMSNLNGKFEDTQKFSDRLKEVFKRTEELVELMNRSAKNSVNAANSHSELVKQVIEIQEIVLRNAKNIHSIFYAVNRAKTTGESFDKVLNNIQSTGLNGVDVVKKIQNIFDQANNKKGENEK